MLIVAEARGTWDASVIVPAMRPVCACSAAGAAASRKSSVRIRNDMAPTPRGVERRGDGTRAAAACDGDRPGRTGIADGSSIGNEDGGFTLDHGLTALVAARRCKPCTLLRGDDLD